MTIAIFNQKGGTGKTTTAINLSCGLAKQNKSVLLLGMDVQGDLPYCLDIENFDKSLSEVFLDEIDINETIILKEGISVIPSNIKLADVELNLIDEENREFLLKRKLNNLKVKYDYVIIDCSPSLSLLTINALCAADKVIVPMPLNVLGVNGLELLLNTLEKVKKFLNPNIQLLGVLLVMVDYRKRLSRDINNYLSENFSFKVFDSQISSNVRAAEAPSFGKSVISYAPNSKSAKDYIALAKELIQ